VTTVITRCRHQFVQQTVLAWDIFRFPSGPRNNRDRYDRLLGTVWYDSTDINAVQVINGMAWAYRYRGKAMVPAYADLEETARKNRKGLWAEPAPAEPWRWRKMQKSDN